MAESVRSATPTWSGYSYKVRPAWHPAGAPHLGSDEGELLHRQGECVATPLESWADEAARLTKPDRVVYCDGSEAEYQRMIAEMLRAGDSCALNEKTYPNCYLHRSSPNDVARTEHLTFICTPTKEDAGPTNNWMEPDAAKHKVGALLDGAMRGRTMYVVPYLMGPVGSPISKVGVEVTDSPYVVASMRIMSRMGD